MMDSPSEKHAALLDWLDSRRRGKHQFDPALSERQRHCFDFLCREIEQYGFSPTVGQLSLRLGWTAERTCFTLLQLCRRGWVSVESSAPAQPERMGCYRGRWYPTVEASAGPHVVELLELAIELADEHLSHRWNARAKADVAALRVRAQTLVRRIADRASRPTRRPAY